jgi:hypothetical protein
MAAASMTPRVRTIVMCDDNSASLTESNVFTLEGVRQHLEAASFPCRADLSVYLLLSSARRGGYPGKILVVHEYSDKLIRYMKFFATFEKDNELLQLVVAADCVFPEPGSYRFEVYFAAPEGGEAQKGEHPFTVVSYEE